jgi:hypothetical protein
MVASLTGQSTNEVLTVRASDATLVFQSDLHVSRAAFSMPYAFSPCPANCSGRGECANAGAGVRVARIALWVARMNGLLAKKDGANSSANAGGGRFGRVCARTGTLVLIARRSCALAAARGTGNAGPRAADAPQAMSVCTVGKADSRTRVGLNQNMEQP